MKLKVQAAEAVFVVVAGMALACGAYDMGGSRGYIVAPGDTLSAIAARNGTTVREIASANGIRNPDRIKAGDHIVISSPGGRADRPVVVRLNRIARRLHLRLGNPNLESAVLANFNRETGGSFDYRTKSASGGYGIPQYTGATLRGYRAWLRKSGRADSEESQIDYFTTVYMKTRSGYGEYVASGRAFTCEQYADWLHRDVFTPAHTIRDSAQYSRSAIARCTRGHNDFMRNSIRLVDGVWEGIES